MSRRMDDEDENVSSSDSGSGSESSSGSDDSSSENSGTSSGDDSEDDESTQKMMGRGSAPGAGANTVQNQPHDEEFPVDNSGGGAAPPPAAATTSAAPAAGSAPPPGGDGNKIANQPHDESFAVDGGDGGSGNQSQTQPAPTKKVSNVKPSISSSGQMKNDPNDEAFDVENDMSSDEDEDSDEDESPPQRTGAQSGSQVIKNRPEDEAFEVDNGGSSASAAAGGTASAAPAPVQKQPAAMPTNNNNTSSGSMQGGGGGGDSSEEDEETGTDTSTEPDTDEEEDSVPRMGPGNAQLQQTTAVANNTSLEYNPADYEFLNAKVSREVRDLFSHISAYQPTTIECPAKLRPFIPEYIPCVGDIDTFCKVPRPDEKPDNFGLTVVDEPSCDQSNPFVVKIALSHTITAGVGGLSDGGNVAMVDEAHLHPQQIDKWISDIKKVSKQLPTVTYTKPMPQIESLMQIWPKEFEDMLNSDVAFPGSGIELDIDQYVRVLCAILDIPTYTNLVESLHVMFTLYLEFRANQHFTHA